MQLYSPLSLALLLILPIVAYQMSRKKRCATVKFPTLDAVKRCPSSWRLRLRPLLIAARLLCITLLIVALARPRKGTAISEISTEGVAMEVVVDRSGSMQTEMNYEGQTLTRLGVVKKVLYGFVNGDEKNGFTGRASDLIGLITFARYPDTISPMVLSHNVLLEFLNKTEVARLQSEDGTAIGDAIALAAARLKKCEEEMQHRKKQLGIAGNIADAVPSQDSFKIKSKIIVLLTDGCNNMGWYEPLAAGELAKKWGIKIYTIGIGSVQGYTTIQTTLGSFKMPTQNDLDEGLLKSLAEKTGGLYGRADNGKALGEIVKKIDSLEKTEVKSVQYTQYAEEFGPWALAAMLVLGLEMTAGCTIFRKIP